MNEASKKERKDYMKDVLITAAVPAVLWLIVLLIYISKKTVERKATEKIIGIVVGGSFIKQNFLNLWCNQFHENRISL